MPGHKKDKGVKGYQLDLETGKALAPEPKKVKEGESELATRLLTLWTEGRLSAPTWPCWSQATQNFSS